MVTSDSVEVGAKTLVSVIQEYKPHQESKTSLAPFAC